MPLLIETSWPVGPADIILSVACAYVAVGLIFAAGFVTRGAARLDPAAARMPLSVRLLILPGTVALWPMLAVRRARAQLPGTRT